MANNSTQYVYYLGVARLSGGKGFAVGNFSFNSETSIDGVKQVLEQPNFNLVQGKHYSFAVGQMAWHLIQDELSLIYILICTQDYPQRCAHMCLEELKTNFCSKVDGHKATTAKDRAFDMSCASLFDKICRKYNNLQEVDKLAALSKKVDAVKLTMQENVDRALQNCVKLESIEKQAEELQASAGVFKKNANELKNKLWWKNMKMWLILITIVLIILAIIIGVAVSMSKKK